MKKLMNLIIWEMHGFSHQFAKVQENATWGGPGKLVLIVSPYYRCFFPIGFPSCGILHYMGNTRVFPLISHGTKKCNKTHRLGKTWEIGTYTFPIVGVLFSRQIRILWYSSLHGKCMGFLINSNSMRKFSKNHQMGKACEISSHTFSIAWVLYSIRLPSCGILHHMRNAWVSPSILHRTGKSNKTQGKAWEIGTPTFPIVWVHSSNKIPIL